MVKFEMNNLIRYQNFILIQIGSNRNINLASTEFGNYLSAYIAELQRTRHLHMNTYKYKYFMMVKF